MKPLDATLKDNLGKGLSTIEELLECDVMTIIAPIVPGLDQIVRDAVEAISSKEDKLLVIHDTGGGVVEVVDRMVGAIRNFYDDVTFLVPDRAMSAGTIFVLSGDQIMMDYFSCLGPIDPQIVRNGELVPALSYLSQFERLNKKAADGQLTTAEFALLERLDLGELHQFEQARELSNELLVKWLCQYKFKNWKKTETRGVEVNEEMKLTRATEIAKILSDNERWHSHGRGLNLAIMEQEIGLKINDYTENVELTKFIRNYFHLLRDYMQREGLYSFVHTREYF